MVEVAYAVLLCLHAEKTKCPDAKLWMDILVGDVEYEVKLELNYTMD